MLDGLCVGCGEGAASGVGEWRGRGEWRRGRDSNPRGAFTPAGFQDRCNQPLCHLSEVGHCLVRGPGWQPVGALRGLAATRGRDGFGPAGLTLRALPGGNVLRRLRRLVEPSRGFHPCRFSRPVQSTALPPLRGWALSGTGPGLATGGRAAWPGGHEREGWIRPCGPQPPGVAWRQRPEAGEPPGGAEDHGEMRHTMLDVRSREP